MMDFFILKQVKRLIFVFLYFVISFFGLFGLETIYMHEYNYDVYSMPYRVVVTSMVSMFVYISVIFIHLSMGYIKYVSNDMKIYFFSIGYYLLTFGGLVGIYYTFYSNRIIGTLFILLFIIVLVIVAYSKSYNYTGIDKNHYSTTYTIDLIVIMFFSRLKNFFISG